LLALAYLPDNPRNPKLDDKWLDQLVVQIELSLSYLQNAPESDQATDATGKMDPTVASIRRLAPDRRAKLIAGLSKVGSDPRRWDAAQLDDAREALRAAHLELERRAVLLSEPASPPALTRLFSPFSSLLPGPKMFMKPPLTAAEVAQLYVIASTPSPAPGKRTASSAPVADGKGPTAVDAGPASGSESQDPGIHFLGTLDLELLSVFAALGALGSCVQGIGSIAAYLGRRKYVHSWFAYYLTRPLVGGIFGPLFYIVLRGGLFSSQANWTDLNIYGYGAVSLLVGFCSAEAQENLKKIGSAFFSKKQDQDGLEDDAPRIDSAAFSSEVHDGKSKIKVRLLGHNFPASALVLIDEMSFPVQAGSKEVLAFEYEAPPGPAAPETVQVVARHDQKISAPAKLKADAPPAFASGLAAVPPSASTATAASASDSASAGKSDSGVF
jgi:hypothetical protein